MLQVTEKGTSQCLPSDSLPSNPVIVSLKVDGSWVLKCDPELEGEKETE